MGEYGVFYYFDSVEPGDFDESGDSGKKTNMVIAFFSGDSGIYVFFGESNNFGECCVSWKSSESGNFNEFGDSEESGNWVESGGSVESDDPGS